MELSWNVVQPSRGLAYQEEVVSGEAGVGIDSPTLLLVLTLALGPPGCEHASPAD